MNYSLSVDDAVLVCCCIIRKRKDVTVVKRIP